MSKHSQTVVSRHEAHHGGSVRSYTVGFATSIYLTITAYLLVTHETFSRNVLVAAIIGLALVQFIVQLIFFLHLGEDQKPRWKLLVFGFMTVVVLILVFGSLWIMTHLNYHMKSPAELKIYMKNEEGL